MSGTWRAAPRARPGARPSRTLARPSGSPRRPGLCLLLLAAALAGAPASARSAEPSDLSALAAEVRSVAPSRVADLVAGDPRFAALSAAEREALLRAVAISPGWRLAASATNLVLGLGIGSLLESDTRGLILTGVDTVAMIALLVAVTTAMAESSSGGSSSAVELAPVAVWVLVASRVAGAILPWTWDGRSHAALARALGTLPPAPEAALLVAPLVTSATGRAAPGATIVLRF